MRWRLPAIAHEQTPPSMVSLAAESRGDQFGVEIFGDFLDLAVDHFVNEAILVVVGLASLGLAAGLKKGCYGCAMTQIWKKNTPI
jgi:hypothetical protein